MPLKLRNHSFQLFDGLIRKTTFKHPGWIISLQIEHSISIMLNLSSSFSTVSSFPASPHTRHTAVWGRTGCKTQKERLLVPPDVPFSRSRVKSDDKCPDWPICTVSWYRTASCGLVHQTSSCLCRSGSRHTLCAYMPHTSCSVSVCAGH